MDYYLKKQKFLCIIVCVFQALSFTMNACIQFLLMKIFDSAAQMNFNLVLFWCCIDIFGWGLYLLFSVLADRIQAKAIWALNNDVRKNIYDSILRQNYKQYHKNDIGEYLSWVTNDIKQIEQLAWIPFFFWCWPCNAGDCKYYKLGFSTLVTCTFCIAISFFNVEYSKSVP